MKASHKGLKQIAAQEFVRTQIDTAKRVGFCTVILRDGGNVSREWLEKAAVNRGLAVRIDDDKVILARKN